jgi:RNA polymerase sigma factor (sigma-70 family)
MVQFLKFGPHFTITKDTQFRALLLRIVENTLRYRHEWFMAKRRKIAKERPLPSETVLLLDPARDAAHTPSKSAERHEREAWIRLGMELLDPKDREILVLRQWDNRSFAKIGEGLDVEPETARMRHNRAVKRLAAKVGALRARKLAEVLEENPS